MLVKYLEHSGFLVESKTAYYVFDYIGGELPSKDQVNENKKWIVFVSHIHQDHFNPVIFEMAKRYNNVIYILSYDVVKKIKHIKKLQELCEGLDIVKANFDEEFNVEDLKIETLKSTDEGVAFIVKDIEGNIYHAGDLNWWHWEGEEKAWNRNMEVNFKREIDKMKSIKLHIAFIPLDPRQENDYYRGMKYFVENVNADEIYPMHFWKQLGIIDKYVTEYGRGNIIDKDFYNE